jgi:arginine-tRNA-protein transferase
VRVRQPEQLVVYDGSEPCPYLSGQIARMPLRFPMAQLTPEHLDACLNEGDRRAGCYLYRPQCSKCTACQPLRIEVAKFVPRASQRRVLRKARQAIKIEIAEIVADRRRVQLFNKHRRERNLATSDGEIDLDGYKSFLVESCCPTFEIRYHYAGELIGIAICDRGFTSLSAVYTFYDPEFGFLSPGTFSVLTQIELCKHWQLQFLYLGYFIAASSHMAYKANFLPHERLINGRWTVFCTPENR